MPFTFAHPALVLPLINKQKKICSVTGLVIGSIIPDFESFLTLDEHKIYGHTWLGVFWFDLPLAIMAAFVFHGIVRDPLIKNLPAYFGHKFVHYINFKWGAYFRKHALMIIISMLIGIVSHLLWDAFTHLNLANPDATDSNILVFNMRLYMILQYSNSLIGLIIVCWYVIGLPTSPARKLPHGKQAFHIDTTIPSGKNKAAYWLILSVVAGMMIALSIHLSEGPVNIILLIEICISGILLGLIMTPLIQRLLRIV